MTGESSSSSADKRAKDQEQEPTGSCSKVDCYGPSPEQIKRDTETLSRTQEAESRRQKKES